MVIIRQKPNDIDVISYFGGFQDTSGPQNSYFRPKSGGKNIHFRRFQGNGQCNIYLSTANDY